MEVFVRLGYLLALLGVGVAARRAGVLNDRRTGWLNDAAFYVALPALVFSSTYNRALGELVSPALVAGVLVVFATVIGLAWLVHRRRPSRARRSVALVQSYHSNLGFLGLPLVQATLGDAASGTAAVVLGVGILVQTPLTVCSLIAINDADADVATELRGVATNPVLIALAAGLSVSTAGLGVPGAVATGLGWVSTLALPIALLCVGASLQVVDADVDYGLTGSVVAMKIGLMPALAWVVFTLLSVDATAAAAVVVMLGMPSAVSTYVYSTELGGDSQLASLNVFATTLASLATVALILEVMG
ncbi:AEC family transporter [Halosimplex aquaticum]|uniref:AEC family transporter n=1 Tax=Halosimplex aquaticum TaxID=3026162 RepID=A0ABD5Y3I2_9EURY|nr:AEC family transporter [Halosimplex aquaticum]